MKGNAIGTIVVDSAVELHRDPGPGWLDTVQEVTLARSLERRGLKAQHQVGVAIEYRGEKFDEGFRADLIVGNLVIVELESAERMTAAHKKQTSELRPGTRRDRPVPHMSYRIAPTLLAGSILAGTASARPTRADDWPTYQHDDARSGVTEERLALPLRPAWVYTAGLAPRPAWPAPAPRDIWHELRQLKPLVTHDRAFHTVSAGDIILFGSSADDAVRALDAVTGRERWVFFTEGPVRLAPTLAQQRAYFGSDDGHVYCLDATNGALLWKYAVNAPAHRFPGNGRLISSIPVRTSILVANDRVTFFAGLFPTEGVYRCVLRATDGTPLTEDPVPELSPQGYLLASPARLVVPTGRTTPAVFDRNSGKLLATPESLGGTYALLSDDFLYNRADRDGALGLSDAATSERIATFDGLAVIVRQHMAYLQTQRELAALDRVRHTALARQRNTLAEQLHKLDIEIKHGPPPARLKQIEESRPGLKARVADLDQAMEACFTWRQACECPYGFILAGNLLFAGGDNQVAAFNRTNGQPAWTAPVQGRAYGLAAANGRLMVSTDTGTIHCFSPFDATHAPPLDTPPTGVVQAVRAGVAASPTHSTPAPPYPTDAFTPRYAQAADRIVALTQVRQGLGLVLGSEAGRLAGELAQRTDLHIVGVETDPAKVAAARQALAAAGLYGSRVVIHQGPVDRLPYNPYLFNLIVSDRTLLTGQPPAAAAEVLRLLRPAGGVACLGPLPPPSSPGDPAQPSPALAAWAASPAFAGAEVAGTNGWIRIRRGPVPAAGEWTQLYANSAHTACSGDTLRGPLTLQWFGEPGPRQIVDRHHRPMSSLVKDGRAFVPGDDVVFAIEAYNGTPLWQLAVPGLRRVGALKDSGQMVLAPDRLYLAVAAACWAVDVRTGEHVTTLAVPQVRPGQTNDWGYLDQAGDRLVGSAQAPGASFRDLGLDTINTLEGDFRPVVVSRALFALDRDTGQTRWTYADGAIMNNAIAIADNRVCCVESRNPAARTSPDGRVRVGDFCAESVHLVALDLDSGRKLYDRPVRLPFQHIFFLNTARNTTLLTGTYNRAGKVYYGLFAFAADSGTPKWNTEYLALDVRANEPAPTDGSHGEQWQHPVIIGDRIYSRPYDFDLETGRQGPKKISRGGHGCGGWTASAHYLFGRGSNPRLYDLALDATDGTPLTTVSRPGCWLNIIPAGGLVLIPESSSGCTCAYPVQTSLALVPRAALSP
jgi:GxxExxY protein